MDRMNHPDIQILRGEDPEMTLLRAAMERVSEMYPSQEPAPLAPPTSPWPPVGKQFYIYFMECRASGHIKIGITKNLKDRYQRFNTMLPMGVSMLRYGKGTPKRERRFHKWFAADRLNGEWFKRTDRLAALMTERAPNVVSHI